MNKKKKNPSTSNFLARQTDMKCNIIKTRNEIQAAIKFSLAKNVKDKSCLCLYSLYNKKRYRTEPCIDDTEDCCKLVVMFLYSVSLWLRPPS